MNKQQRFVDFVYNVDKINVVFAITSVVLVFSVLWMVWDDYDREWKDLQHEAMKLEAYKTEAELQAAQEEVDPDVLQAIEQELREIEASIQAHQARYEAATETLHNLTRADWYIADQGMKFEKAKYDVVKYEYEEAVHSGHAKQAAAKKAEMEAMERRSQELRLQKEAVEVKQAEQQKIIDSIVGNRKALEQKKGALHRDAGLLERKLSGLEPSFPNKFRNMPMVDFIDPSIKIRQIVLADLKNDMNFIQVPKVDRCVTCHVNIDRPGFELDPETGLFKDELLRTYVDEVYTEGERIGRSKVFASHPNLDLFMSSGSPHPSGEVGCTACHMGRDRGVTFNRTAHTPSNEEEAKRWEEQYGWKEMHHWDYPMLPSQYVEASCAHCHTNVVDVPRADNLNRGVHLVRTLGCNGCHKIAKPHLQDLRKVGPDLRKVAGKLDAEWALKWVRDPKGFRPSTKMPKIFDLPNVSSPEDIARNTAAVHAAVTYLFEKSEHPTYPNPPVKGDSARGRGLVEKVGCRGCHVVGEGDVLEQDYSLRNFGPNLNDVGSKLSAGWLFAWLKDPTAYFPDTKMPNLRLTDQEAADITAYLLGKRNLEFEDRQPAAVDKTVRDQLVVNYLQARLPVMEAQNQLTEMSDHERDIWLGEKIISRQGCFSCHLIPGFENAQPIGTELTEEGSKDVHKLDFGMNPTNINHTRQDWFLTKLKTPRVFDEGKVKAFDDKLRMPDFGLSDDDADALVTALLSFSKSHIDLPATKQLKPDEIEIEKGRWVVYERNCKGCHVIEGEGGAIRGPLVDSYGKEGIAANEAVGFTPPILNGEGKKVQPDWFFGFLKEVIPIRPWLDARMPTFGFEDQEAIDVVTYFSRLDRQQFPYHSFEEKQLTRQDIKGAEILFSTDIYNCWTCHQQGDIKPKGDPASWAPDLTMARERLKPEWIRSWLWDPQQIQPGTKMPTFFGDEMTYLPENLSAYLKLPEGTKPEDGILVLPSDIVIRALVDYIVFGLHQDKRLTSR